MQQRFRILLAVLLMPAISNADIYRVYKANGQVIYTNQPAVGSRHTLFVRSKPTSYLKDLQNASVNKALIQSQVEAIAQRHHLSPKLLHAVIQTESAYNPNAISKAGAVGLMQLMPDTAKRYGISDRQDVMQNLDAGTRYLKDLLALFNNDLKLALAGYNAGEGAVIKYKNTIPPYPETQHYVSQVLQLFLG
jgi:soluble lytic murein transglycosylase-like protein